MHRLGCDFDQWCHLLGRGHSPVLGVPRPDVPIPIGLRMLTELLHDTGLERLWHGPPAAPGHAILIEENCHGNRAAPIREMAIPELRVSIPGNDAELEVVRRNCELVNHGHGLYRVSAPVVRQNQKPSPPLARRDPPGRTLMKGCAPGDGVPEGAVRSVPSRKSSKARPARNTMS